MSRSESPDTEDCHNHCRFCNSCLWCWSTCCAASWSSQWSVMIGSSASANCLKPFNTSPMTFMQRYTYGGGTAPKVPSLLVDETKWNNGSFLGKKCPAWMSTNMGNFFFSIVINSFRACVTVCQSFDLVEACLSKVSNLNVMELFILRMLLFVCVFVLCVCVPTHTSSQSCLFLAPTLIWHVS